MPPLTTSGGGIMLFGRSSDHPSVRPLTPISHDAISLYLVEGFQGHDGTNYLILADAYNSTV